MIQCASFSAPNFRYLPYGPNQKANLLPATTPKNDFSGAMTSEFR
jgi:hypothetical protein